MTVNAAQSLSDIRDERSVIAERPLRGHPNCHLTTCEVLGGIIGRVTGELAEWVLQTTA
jgi:hypothetical protein